MTFSPIIAPASVAASVASSEYADANDNPRIMTEPAFMLGLNDKSPGEIREIIADLSPIERAKMAVYIFFQGRHYRIANEDRYAGADTLIYQHLAIFAPGEMITKMTRDDKPVFMQAPERSGKTLHVNLQTLIGYHMGWNGIVAIGSAKDNAISVRNDLEKNRQKFMKFVKSDYDNIAIAYKDVFRKDIWGPTFKFYDGSMSETEMTKLMGTDNIDNRGMRHANVPVFSGAFLAPAKMLQRVIRKYREIGDDHFIMFDEADAVIKPMTSSTSKQLPSIIEDICGMRAPADVTCPACGDTHRCCEHDKLKPIGFYGPAKKITLLSATMNLVVELCNSFDSPRIEVMRPLDDPELKLNGGAGDHIYQRAEKFGDPETKWAVEDFTKWLTFDDDVYNQRFEYYLDFDLETFMTEDDTRHPSIFHTKKPLMPGGAEEPWNFKTNVCMLIEATPFVVRDDERKGGKKNDEEDENRSQMMIVDNLFGRRINDSTIVGGEMGTEVGIPDGAVCITSFAGGAKIRRRGWGHKNDLSVKDIIRIDNLEEKVEQRSYQSDEDKEAALKNLEDFKKAVDVKSTMEFVSWYYGVHLPVFVVAFNKGQRAVDMCDDDHVITHFIMIASDSKGSDSVKQQAGRCKAPVGKILRCNLPADFKPLITTNVDLKSANDLEQMPLHNKLINSKREVTEEIKEAKRRFNVLDKASKRYEPEVRMLRVIGEDDEEEEVADAEDIENAEMPTSFAIDVDTIWGRIAYLFMTEAENREYRSKELITLMYSYKSRGLVTFKDKCDLYINELGKKKKILNKITRGVYTIRKDIPFTIVNANKWEYLNA
jgi:hypothetical protein